MEHTNTNEKKAWETGATFKSDDGTMEVKVNVLRLFRPVYSLQVCGANGGRFLRITVEGKGQIEIVPINTITLERLIRDAEDWVKDDRQKREDEIIAEYQAREAKRFDHDKKEPRHTGKTEKNRERRRGKES